MPSLLEQIGWQREQDFPTSGGVSYYSPAAQVRPSGSLANSSTAQRILGGGGTSVGQAAPQGFRGAGPQMGPAPQFAGPQVQPAQPMQAPAPIVPGAGGSIADQMLARLSQQNAQQPAEPSGVEGILGKVVNTLPGRAVMSGLNAMGYPLRGVAASIDEVADAVGGGDADWGEWWDHFTDPSYGMGDVIPKTGNIWVDRVTGFAGDVLFDPTTYLLGSGAMAGMGRAVRAKAAARIVAEGFGDDIAKTVGRYGYSALDNETRSMLRKAGHAIEDAGWRFRVPGQKTGSPIKMTGGLERVVSGASSRVRAGLYKVPGMSRLSAWRTPEGLEAAYMKLIAGRGDTSIAEAAEVINMHEWHKVAAGTVHARLKQSATNMMKAIAKAGDDPQELLRRAQTEGGTALNDFFDEAQQMGMEYGLKFHGRKNYAPNLLDPRAVAWMKGETPQARAFRSEFSIGAKIEDVSPILLERKMVPRTEPYDIMGRKLQISNGSIDEWNTAFKEAFPELDFKLMIDDVPTIISTYLMHFADDVGTVAATRRLAQSKSGITAGYHDEYALKEVIDEVATTRMSDEAGKKLQAEYKMASDATKSLHDETMQGVHGIQGLIGVQMRGMLDEITNLSDATRERYGSLILEEMQIADQIGARRVGPNLYDERDQVADQLLVANRRYMDAAESGNQAQIAKTRGQVEELSRRMRSIAAPDMPEAPRIGKLQEAYDATVRELDTKIGLLDSQMKKAHERAIAESKIYSEAETLTRGRRMADVDKVRKARDAYESILAARASAEMDRQAIFAIQDRIMQRKYKQELIGKTYDNPSMLALFAGEKVNKRQPMTPGEVRTPSGEYRIVGMEGQYSNAVKTPQQVRREYANRRNAVLPQTAEMADYSARIQTAENAAARADSDLQRAMEVHGPVIEEAKAALNEAQDTVMRLEATAQSLRQQPEMQEAAENFAARAQLMRERYLRPAQENYRMASDPVRDAETRRRFAIHELERLEREQEEAALGSAIGGAAAPTMPTPEPLPHTPQRVGQASAQLSKDERMMRHWRGTDSAAEVRRLTGEHDDIMREYQREKLVFDQLTTGPYAAFKLDSNGNLTPAGSLDQVSKRMIRQRDAQYEIYKRAKQQVEVLEDLQMQGDDVGDELFRATRDRDEAKTQLDSYHADLIRDRIDRFVGTRMEQNLKEALDLQKRIGALEKAADARTSRIKKIKRKIIPIEERISRNRKILEDQSAAQRRNAELTRRPDLVTPSEKLRQRLASIKSDRAEALRRADEAFIGYRPVLEQVPTVNVATPVRAIPLSDQFYVDRYFAEMTGGGLPTRPNELSVDDADALRGAYRILRDADMYRVMTGMQDPPAVSNARAVIKQIESIRDPTWTRAALATQDTIQDSVNELERIRQARQVFTPPPKGTPQDLALRARTRPTGGSKELAHRASEAWSAINQSYANADALVADGALNKRQQERIAELLKELDYNMRTYAGDLGDETNPLISPYTGKTINPIDPATGERLGGAPSLQVAERLEQNVADAFRISDFVTRYKAFMEAGGQPSPAASSYILGQGLRQEVKVLDTQIRTVEDLIDSGLTKKWADWETRINKHKATIAEQETIISRIDREFDENGYMDARAKKKAQNRKGEAQRLMNKLLENEPDTGFISDQVNAFQDFLTQQVIDVDDATQYLRNTRDMRRVIDYPASERARLENMVPYYTAHTEELRLSVNRRRQAINKAINEGSDEVTFTLSEQPAKIELTVEQAQEMLPNYTKDQQVEVQKAINAAKAAGRNNVTIGKFPRRRVTMPLDQAQEELAKVEAAIDSNLDVIKAAQLKLDVFTGQAQVHRDRLAKQLQIVLQPPDPERLGIMQTRLARMDAQKRMRPGQWSPGDQRRMDALRADIELATNPPGPEEVADLQAEHKLYADTIKGVEDSINGDLDWLSAVVDSGQEFFTRLVNGERAPTREEINILKDLLGGEAGDVANQWIQAANDVLDRYGTNISAEDMSHVYEAIRRSLGETGDERTISEQIVSNVFGQMDEGGLVTVDKFRSEVINAMVAAAKVRHNDELRRFAQMFDMMGLRVFSGRSKADVQRELELLVQAAGEVPTTAQAAKIRLLQKELDAPGTGYTRKSMLQAVGYNMSRQTFDRHTMRKFILQQFSQQGFDPVEALQDRLLTLKMRRQRTRSMIRGLGLGTNEPALPMRPFRIMYGEAQAGQVPEAAVAAEIAEEVPPDFSAEIDEAVEASKQIAAEEVAPTPPAPASSGRPRAEIQAEIDATMADESIPMKERGARIRELMQEMENPSPAAAAEPPEPPSRVAAIEAEIAELEAEMDLGPANITDMMERHKQLTTELEAARGTVPQEMEPPPAAAAPPPEAAAAPPGKPPKKDTYKNITTGGWESSSGYKIAPIEGGGYSLYSPKGTHLGEFKGPKQAKAAIEAHKVGMGFDAEGKAIKPTELTKAMESAGVTPPEPPPAAAAVPTPPPEEPTLPGGITPEEAEMARRTLEEGGTIADVQAQSEVIRAAQEAEEVAPAVAPPGYEDRLFEIENRITELNLAQAERDLTDDEAAELGQLGFERNRLLEAPPPVDPVVGAYGPEGMNSPEFLQHAMDRDLSPEAYAEWLRYEARKMSRPDEVVYDWENILFKGGPRYDMARGLRRTGSQFDAQMRRMSSVGIRPSGAFTEGMLPEQARVASHIPATVRRARQQLGEMAGRTEQEIEELGAETVRLASSAEQKELAASRQGELGQAYEAEVAHLQAADVRAEAQRRAEIHDAEQRRIIRDQGKLAYEKYQAEHTYTQKLQEANIGLHRVRTGIAAAWHDVTILDRTKQQLENALNTTPQSSGGLRPLLDDLRQVNRMRRGLGGQVPAEPFVGPRRPGEMVGSGSWMRSADENDIILVESMIDSAIDAQMKLANSEVTEELLDQRLKNWKNAANPKAGAEALGIEPVMERIVRDGWTQIASRLLTEEDAVYVTDGLARALRNAKVSWKDENFWAQVEKYTAFFKTFATATPGFHVRNALSSAFMNAVAGVRVKHMGPGMSLWKQFRQNPRKFWAEADEDTRTAFAMVFGSGAGGQFLERGLGPETNIGGKLYRAAMNNAFTRFNRRMGEWVEGPVRLAMALDSVDRGMSLLAGSSRITHYHFNYNEVSKFDRAAKRMIPFWTFMSRNIPLQIMEMWVHPRTYQHYMAFVRNFQEPGDPLTPEYWLSQGAFTMDENAEKSQSPWYLAPDLPFLRVGEPVEAAMQGDWGKALLSDINPAIAAPLEAFGVNKKFYTGAPIEGYSEPEGAMKMFTPLFDVLGMTETGGKTGETLTPESWQHMIRTLLPTVGLAERLTSNTGVRAGRQGETWARALGAPVYKLTPELREQTKRTEYAKKREKLQTQVDLARS